METDRDRLDAANRSAYATDEAVGWYAAQSDLKPAERRLLTGLGEQLTAGRLLDLGIGGGRTTGPLAELAGSYVGIDYVPELVAAARRNHPGVRIEEGDARDLRAWPDDSFDVVFFSFNGIDGLTHDDRLLVLAEIRRVLAPGGSFLFSAHHRDWSRAGRLPWQGRSLVSRVVLKQSLAALLAVRTRRRLRREEVHTTDYAILNDQAHHWSLLLYYVSAPAQVAQLEAAGFHDVRVHDMDGEPIDPADAPSGRPDSIWLHYLARS